MLRHLGVFGLFLLAIADSTPLPTFAGPDILTAIFAARHRDPWYYYAAVATAGSVIGAYITYRMAQHAGAGYMRDKFGERRVAKLLAFFKRWGTGALVLSSAVPFPSPTSAFFAAAGVLNYRLRNFVVVVALSRAARYAAIASIASHYGRHFILALRHPAKYYGVLLLIAASRVRARSGGHSRCTGSWKTPATSSATNLRKPSKPLYHEQLANQFRSSGKVRPRRGV